MNESFHDQGDHFTRDFIVGCLCVVSHYSCGHVTITCIDGFKIYPLTVVLDIRLTICCVMYRWCSGAYMIWLVYLKKLQYVECFVEC